MIFSTIIKIVNSITDDYNSYDLTGFWMYHPDGLYVLSICSFEYSQSSIAIILLGCRRGSLTSLLWQNFILLLLFDQVHGRTKEMKKDRTGTCDWNIIKRIKQVRLRVVLLQSCQTDNIIVIEFMKKFNPSTNAIIIVRSI